jgi:hypothetical protein
MGSVPADTIATTGAVVAIVDALTYFGSCSCMKTITQQILRCALLRTDRWRVTWREVTGFL